MISTYVVVEGETDRRVLERVLPAPLVDRATIVVGTGRAGGMSMARSLAATQRAPVAVVLDADTTDEAAAASMRAEMLGALRSRAVARTEVVLFVPEVEAIFFYEKDLLEHVLGREVDETTFFEGRRKPKKVLHDLVEPSLKLIPVMLLERIDAQAAARLRRHPPFPVLMRFIEHAAVHYALLEGPQDVLDAVADAFEDGYADAVARVGSDWEGTQRRPRRLRLYLHQDVEAPYAEARVLEALDKALRARGLAHRRDDLTVTLHDETGDEVPVPA